MHVPALMYIYNNNNVNNIYISIYLSYIVYRLSVLEKALKRVRELRRLTERPCSPTL